MYQFSIVLVTHIGGLDKFWKKECISIFSVMSELIHLSGLLRFFCLIQFIAYPGSYIFKLTMLHLLCKATTIFLHIVSWLNYFPNPEH